MKVILGAFISDSFVTKEPNPHGISAPFSLAISAPYSKNLEATRINTKLGWLLKWIDETSFAYIDELESSRPFNDAKTLIRDNPAIFDVVTITKLHELSKKFASSINILDSNKLLKCFKVNTNMSITFQASTYG